MSAVDFLFTPSVQRVLAATLAEPGRSFTLEDLLVLGGGGRGSTQQQVERLVAAGVLLEEPRRGRQRSLRVNTSYFLYEELASIARKSFGLAEPLRAALRPWANAIDEAFVFGSVAKGTDSAASDVDLAVIGSPSLLELGEAVHNAGEALGRHVHLSVFEPAEWLDLVARDPVMAQIAHGPRIRVLPDESTRSVRESHRSQGL